MSRDHTTAYRLGDRERFPLKKIKKIKMSFSDKAMVVEQKDTLAATEE